MTVGRTNGSKFVETSVFVAYRPVNICARDGQHSDVWTYALSNSTPWSTSFENTFGMMVRLKVECAWSSLTRSRMLGRLGVTAGRTAPPDGDATRRVITTTDDSAVTSSAASNHARRGRLPDDRTRRAPVSRNAYRSLLAGVIARCLHPC